MTMKRLICAGLWCALLASSAPGAGFPAEVSLPEEHEAINVTRGIDLAFDRTNMYVTSYWGHYVAVFDREGNEVNRFGNGRLNYPCGIATDGDRVYITESWVTDRIQAFKTDGTFLWQRGNSGSGQGQFNDPTDCCVVNGLLYVTDDRNHRIQVFTTGGDFAFSWGQAGGLPGEFNQPHSIASLEDRIYVLDNNGHVQVFSLTGDYIRSFDVNQTRVGGGWNICCSLALDGANVFVGATDSDRKDAYIFVYDYEGNEVFRHHNKWSGTMTSPPTQGNPLSHPYGLAFRDGQLFIADYGRFKVIPTRRVFRTPGSPASRTNSLPRAVVRSAVQRVGSGVVDIDFEVVDANSPTVMVHAIAFEGDATTLAKAIPMRTFVEGTETNLGAAVHTGVTNRLSWDASADWAADYGDVRMAFLCREAPRDLLDLHFLELPALYGNPAVTINRVAITQQDLLPVWIWLVAANDPAVRFDAGAVYGVGGGYHDELLADDSGTTAEGRAFLFARLGIREATAAELQYAREATTPGSVTKWSSRFRIDGRPTHVNEFCFDTGSTEGWFVVEE